MIKHKDSQKYITEKLLHLLNFIWFFFSTVFSKFIVEVIFETIEKYILKLFGRSHASLIKIPIICV